MEPRWFQLAKAEIGQREIAGRRHNPKILQWWTAIRAPFTDDETPWCGAFVGGMLAASGVTPPRNAASALSFASWGQRLAKPVIGCFVVFRRRGGGHVGFYAGEDGPYIKVLGGNQGNMVNVSRYQKHGSTLKLVGYFWPPEEPLPTSAAGATDLDAEVYQGGPVTLYGDQEKPSLFRRIFEVVTGTSLFGGLTYMTSWQVAIVIVAGLMAFALVTFLIALWLFGPDRLRSFIKKKVT